MHGQFAWYELTTSDTDAAQKFYKTFTGWGTQPFDADYTMLTSNGVPIAGVFRLTDELKAQGVPPNWMPYVEVRNVQETVKLATSLSANVMHGPQTVPDVGDIAVIQDPQGAVFGVYKKFSDGPSWDGTPVVGKFSWNELMTSDHPQAFEFYQRLFGWDKVNEMDMGDGLMYLLFGKGEAQYGGMFTTPAEMSGMHPFWLCYIHVKDVPKALATATKNGAFVHRPPVEIPGGVIAILGDPQGAGFALHHNSASPTTATPATSKTKPSSKAKAKTVAGKANPAVRKSKVATRKTRSVRKKKTAKSSRKKSSSASTRARRKSTVRSKAKKKK